jgi:tetratricopeptide (TPR) repeat protein
MKRAIAGLCWITLGLLLPHSTLACLWDTDTLANEAKGLPDVVQVITGRFERNPPLYYEMRLKRVTAELARDPGLLNAYDDAAVACDRLSRDDEAIVWMEKKSARMVKTQRTAPNLEEHWYRYYANIGTFRAHRWLRAGADRKRIAEMEKAREEIAQAIALNPNAHFGREKVQLAFMDWLITEGKESYPSARDIATLIQGTQSKEQNRKGLCGLIVLGNAWESVDSFLMLSDYSMMERSAVRYLAALRCRELLRQGHHSLHPQSFPDAWIMTLTEPTSMGVSGNIHTEIEEQYRQLRAEAESWQKRRTDYMMARLTTGSHPDTDPTFWNAWKDTPPPSLEVSPYRYLASRFWNPIYIASHLEFYLLGLATVGVGIKLAQVVRRRRKARTSVRSNTLS